MAQLYIGTYTRGSGGIHRIEMNMETGALTGLALAAECASPSFLAFGRGGRLLCAVNETADYEGARTGSVSALRRDPATGKLELLNVQSSHGAHPCHINVDSAGRNALVANYSSGTVAVLPIEADGRLAAASCVIQHKGSSVNASRQEGPHAHSVNLAPGERIALVCDLGTDQVLIYRYDAARGMLAPAAPIGADAPGGAGPRHLAFHPNGRWVYVINELDSTVTTYRYESRTGALTPVESVSTLPAGYSGQSTTAEVVVHPNGKWVYGSNRGHDSIATFAVNPSTGALRPISHEPSGGKTPRSFIVDATGRFLIAANQDSNSIVVFRIEEATGRLSPTECRADVPLPVCLRFAPTSSR